jgi:glycosyltransferase involved in cell wall biosynthesis
MEIVYFGNAWAAENRTSSHHIAERLGRRFRLLYVETPGLRTPSANTRDLKLIRNKIAAIGKPPTPIGKEMWRFTMPQLPFRRLPGVPSLNRALGPMLVRRAMRRLGFREPILWFAVPHASVVRGKLGERASVYYCIDDYAALPGVDTASVRAIDETLTREAELLYVASPVLFERKRHQNPHAHFSPHGVDFELFSQAMDEALPVAEPARQLRHPVIGYFGVISGGIDVELLEYVAESRPQYTLLVIGHPQADPGRLPRLPNVVLQPPVPYRSLPSWAKAFDVAVIPYRMTDQILHANPLKLREYLATGKPVVSTWTPEVERFAHVVQIARSREEYVQAIDRALAEDSPSHRQARLDSVRPLTWDARVEEVLRIFHQRFPAPAAGAGRIN